MSFLIDNSSRAPDIPVYSHADTRLTWTLTEYFSKTELITQKPNVNSFSDVKGDFGDYTIAFRHFMTLGSVEIDGNVHDIVPKGFM